LRPLEPHETLTIAIAVPKIFTPLRWYDIARDNAVQLVGLVGVPVLFGGMAIKRWWRKGRDFKGRGVIVPEYQAPKGLTPAEAGLIADYKLDGRDLSATLIDLAIRGYIKIHDKTKRSLFTLGRTVHQFSFELLKDDTKLKSHERALIDAVFDSVGSVVSLTSLDRTKMYSSVKSIRESLNHSLSAQGSYFEADPSKAGTGMLALSIVVVVLAGVFRPGWGWTIGLGLTAAITFVVSLQMARRSAAGVVAFDQLEGLKLYMNTAERDRLKMMQSVDRPFAEPQKTVHLYEKLLPFAIALGVEKSWSKQFEDIYKQPPGWYQGNWSTFSMHSFSRGLTQSVHAMNTNFSRSTSSSSSGSGGGGSSGGGGGGGGGGGW
jgi:uncharacterized membrane protein